MLSLLFYFLSPDIFFSSAFYPLSFSLFSKKQQGQGREGHSPLAWNEDEAFQRFNFPVLQGEGKKTGENATSREQPLGLGEKENAALLFCRSRFQTRSPGLSPEVSRRRILRFPRERGCPGPHGTPRPPTALPRSFKGDGNSPQPRGDSSSPCPSFSSFGEHRAVSGRGISLSVRAGRGGLRNKAISLARGGRCRMGAGDVSLRRVEGGWYGGWLNASFRFTPLSAHPRRRPGASLQGSGFRIFHIAPFEEELPQIHLFPSVLPVFRGSRGFGEFSSVVLPAPASRLWDPAAADGRVTESQNGGGWKGPLWVTQSNPKSWGKRKIPLLATRWAVKHHNFRR